MIQCVWCSNWFEGSPPQKYCSPECKTDARAYATGLQLRKSKISRRKAAGKRCIVCGTVLSMYGEGNTCDAHINPKTLNPILTKIRKMG